MSKGENTQEAIAVSWQLRTVLKEIEDRVDKLAGRHIGLCLILFTDGRAQYVSNCDRQDVIPPLQMFLDKWKEGMPDIEAHKVQ